MVVSILSLLLCVSSYFLKLLAASNKDQERRNTESHIPRLGQPSQPSKDDDAKHAESAADEPKTYRARAHLGERLAPTTTAAATATLTPCSRTTSPRLERNTTSLDTRRRGPGRRGERDRLALQHDAGLLPVRSTGRVRAREASWPCRSGCGCGCGEDKASRIAPRRLVLLLGRRDQSPRRCC